MPRNPAASATFRIATFNVENLFARYRFRANFDPRESDGFTINNLAFEIYDDIEKRITAKAIAEVDADIIALQEVENLPVLDRFHAQFLRGYLKRGPYPYRLLIDGNDPRQIDVAVMSRYPVLAVRSHKHERDKNGGAPLFSRDCLVVHLDVEGRPLSLYVNHLKSMMEGRKQTRARREEQSSRVADIVDRDWKPGKFEGNFAVLGDMNDYPEAGHGITRLLDHPELINIVERLPIKERWTHYFNGGKAGEKIKQLDYIFLGRKLDNRAGQPKPGVMRKGLPWRAADYAGDRFEGVGEDNPKASDHCPTYVDLPIAALDI